MIRINLLGGRKNLPASLVHAVAALGLLVVTFYWAKQITPGDFLSDEDPETVILEEPVVHLDAQGQRLATPPAETASETPEDQPAERASSPQAETAVGETTSVGKPAQAASDTVPAPAVAAKMPQERTLAKAPPPRQLQPVVMIRRRPYRSDACRRVIQLSGQLPATIRFTSMSSEMDGYFSLGGISPEGDIKILQAFSDSLARVAVETNLSYWRSATGIQPPYNFTIDGQLVDGEKVGLPALAPGEATQLLQRVSGSAFHSGLDSLHLEEPIRIPLETGLTHHRNKIWALGSFDEIRAFIGALEADEDKAVLRELAVSPIGAQHIKRPQARLYAALDFVVGSEGE